MISLYISRRLKFYKLPCFHYKDQDLKGNFYKLPSYFHFKDQDIYEASQFFYKLAFGASQTPIISLLKIKSFQGRLSFFKHLKGVIPSFKLQCFVSLFLLPCSLHKTRSRLPGKTCGCDNRSRVALVEICGNC